MCKDEGRLLNSNLFWKIKKFSETMEIYRGCCMIWKVIMEDLEKNTNLTLDLFTNIGFSLLLGVSNYDLFLKILRGMGSILCNILGLIQKCQNFCDKKKVPIVVIFILVNWTHFKSAI